MFSPTYIYIKRHTKTGKLYFGKSTRTEEQMLKYNGSGKYWKSHIKTHGKEYIETIWYCLFLDENDMREFAIQYSQQEDIVNSNIWANLREENGIDGFPKGIKHTPWTDERRKNKSIEMTGRNIGIPRNNKIRDKISKNRKGKGLGPQTEEHRLKISAATLGKKKSPRTAEHQAKLIGSFQPGESSWNKGLIGLKRQVKNITCPFCNKEGKPGAMKRWHFNNCKDKV
jgi:hypothetical protein